MLQIRRLLAMLLLALMLGGLSACPVGRADANTTPIRGR